MRERLSYAFGRTKSVLGEIFGSDVDSEVSLAFILTTSGFAGIQFATKFEASNFIIATIFTLCVMSVIFFLSIVGFIAFAGIMYAFVYYFIVGCSYKLENLGLNNR